MAIILDWKIRTRNPQCEHTGKPFQDGEEFYTCIFDDPESDGFLRRDFSASVWDEARGTLETQPFSRWKSVFQVPVVEEDEPAIRDTSAEGMLRRMIDEDDPNTENARFILALMLERKKTLIPTDVKDTETRRLLFYEHKDTGDVFIVADPQLKLDEIAEIQKEVSELLDREEKQSEVGGETGENSGEDDKDSSENSSEEPAEAEDESVEPSG